MRSPSKSQLRAAEKWGRWENYLEDYLVDPRVIVDVGANIGYSALFFAKHYPNAKIIALEPVKENFDCLFHNVAELPNIDARKIALGNAVGDVYLSMPSHADNLGLMSVLGNGIRPEKAFMCRLDDIVSSADFIKMDVEGYEHEVISGGMKLIEKCSPLMQVEGNDKADKLLKDLGYKCIAEWHGDDIYAR